MSTVKPRITITLEPSAYEVLRRLSAASGDSMSAVVSNFLDVALPQMERMVFIFEQANGISALAKEEVRESLLRGEVKLMSALNEAQEQSFAFVARAESAVRAAAASEAEPRARRPAAAGSTPVPLTGGSGRVGKPVKPVKTAPVKGGRRGCF